MKNLLYKSENRLKIGFISGIIGVIFNLILFSIKMFAGIFSKSIAIISDAFNNLSDAGSSIITIIGFKYAEKPADKEHPFGHGRVEYVAGLIISFLIFYVGIELLISSVKKIFSDEVTQFTLLSFIVLIISIIVKIVMYFFNKKMSDIINSKTLYAAAKDSVNDAISTFIVLLGYVVSHYLNIQIDGYLGIVVSVVIFYSGVEIFKETLSLIIGEAPKKDFITALEKKVLASNCVLGVHDINVHNYGANKQIISLHAEIDSNQSLIDVHKVIDKIELQLENEFNCENVIHMDPVISNTPEVFKLSKKISEIVSITDCNLICSNFRIVRGEKTTVIFDLNEKISSNKILDDIILNVEKNINNIYNNLSIIIKTNSQRI